MGTGTLIGVLSTTADGTGPAPETITTQVPWFFVFTVTEATDLSPLYLEMIFEQDGNQIYFQIFTTPADPAPVQGQVYSIEVPWTELELLIATNPPVPVSGETTLHVDFVEPIPGTDTWTWTDVNYDLELADLTIELGPVKESVYPGTPAPIPASVTSSDGYPIPIYNAGGYDPLPVAGLIKVDPPSTNPALADTILIPGLEDSFVLVDLTAFYLYERVYGTVDWTLTWVDRAEDETFYPVFYGTVTLTGATSGSTDFFPPPGPPTAPTDAILDGSLTLSATRGGTAPLQLAQTAGIGAGGQILATAGYGAGPYGEGGYGA